MKKNVYRLANIDCAACALKIEDKLNKTLGVESASLNFMLMKLFVTFDEKELDNPEIARKDLKYDFKVFAPNPYDYVTYIDLPLVENHKDPFDRLLISLCIAGDYVFLSSDSKVGQYKADGLKFIS